MKYWEHVESEMPNAEEWRKGDMKIMVNSAVTCFCPVEDCEDYFERTDMMSTAIFHYALIGVALGVKQGRAIVWDNFDRDEAIWMLGWLGLIPTQQNSDALEAVIQKQRDEHETQPGNLPPQEEQ